MPTLAGGIHLPQKHGREDEDWSRWPHFFFPPCGGGSRFEARWQLMREGRGGGRAFIPQPTERPVPIPPATRGCCAIVAVARRSRELRDRSVTRWKNDSQGGPTWQRNERRRKNDELGPPVGDQN
jgi:hypothetical protein